MKIPAAVLFIARLLFLAFVILSTGYCLLAYIPFTYQQIHVGGLLNWLNTFVRFHPLFYWLALGLAGLSISPELQERPYRKSAWVFIAVGAVAGIGLATHPVLANLRNAPSSAVWAVLWLTPAVWLGALDLLSRGSELRWAEVETVDEGRVFSACWQTGLFLALSYFGADFVRIRAAHSPEISTAQGAWVLAAAVVTQLLLWMMVFCLLELMQLAAAKTEQKVRAAFIGSVLATWFLGWLVIRFVIFPTLSLMGTWNWVLSISVSGAVAIYFSGTSVRLSAMTADRIESGLGLSLQPFRFLEDAAWWFRCGALAAVTAAGWYLSRKASLLDWDFLIQKTLVSVIAVVAFAIFYFINKKDRSSQPATTYAVAGMVLLAYLCVGALEPNVTHAADGTAGATRLLDQYADYDVAFRMADDLLTQPKVGTRHSGAHENFYAFLAENTHIPRSRQVAPVDVQLVKSIVPAERKPNIFVFVIDSLRRDYVSPYNPTVDFTPEIEAFAGESVVFNNAFTRYGGTGLSEPSIWMGGLMLHKQYITPFAPMNALQKLMDAEQYQQFVSKDTILQTVVGPSNAITELDAHIGTMNYEFCATLTELTGKLSARKDDARPVFAYTQPQNIHVSVIDHEGRSVPTGANAPEGFDRAYASRVRRMDGCFGNFIQFLKQSGMYENSIVVLTSDHGDFLGERGQWGHAYSLAPEVTRVPLIVHLPEWMKAQVVVDTNAVAFTTDVTPSLYYLLGQKPVVRNGIYGRPLFSSGMDRTEAVHDSYLLASSYAPVYGLLLSNGHLLYVADGVNYTDSAYEIGSDGSNAQIAVTPELRKRGQQGISDQVNEVAHFYRLR
jgi:hypothetical protein